MFHGPPPVRDLANGFKFSWNAHSPHYNVEPCVGGHGPASLVYLSDQANNSLIESTHQKLNEALLSHAIPKACAAGLTGEKLSDVIVRAQDRLCVIFRRDNHFYARGSEGTNLIDTPASKSPVDFTEDRS